MVECHASDLIARVRFPLLAPSCYRFKHLTYAITHHNIKLASTSRILHISTKLVKMIPDEPRPTNEIKLVEVSSRSPKAY